MKRPSNPPDDDGPYWLPEPEASLVLRLLDGITSDVPDDDYSRIRYLTPAEEVESRRALAQLLRTRKRPGPPGRDTSITKREALFNEVCHRLADLFDPPTRPWQIVFTEIGFNKKGPGQPPQQMAKYKISCSVQNLVKKGLGVDEAVAQVAERHKLSTRRIYKMLAHFRTEQ